MKTPVLKTKYLRKNQNFVLHVIGARSVQYGAFEDHLISLSENCQKKDLSLVAVYPDLPKNAAFVRDLRGSGGQVLILPPTMRSNYRSWLALWQTIKNHRPKMVHAHFGRASYFAILAARLQKVPKVFLTKHYNSGSKPSRRHMMAYRLVASMTDKIICVSDVVKSDLLSLGTPNDKLKIIPIGVNTAKFKSRSIDRTLLDDVCPELTEAKVLVVSHLRPGKGLEFLLDAIPDLLREFPLTTFLIAGEGPLFSELYVRANDLKINRRLRFLGLRQDIPELLAACDLFISPSLDEGGGSSILEAMAAGKPVISTPVGHARSLIKNGTNGFLVPIGDSKAISRALYHLIAKQELWANIGRKARQTVESGMRTEKSAMEMAELYVGKTNGSK